MSPTTTVRAAPNSNSSLMIKKLAGDLFRPARFDYNTTTDRATNVRHLPRGATVVKDFAPHQATKLLKPGTARERRGRGRVSEEEWTDACREFDDARRGGLPPRLHARRRRRRHVAARLRRRPRD